MDAHAHLDLVGAQFKSRLRSAGNLAGRQRNANCAAGIDGGLRRGGDFGENRAGIGFGARDLVGIDDARDAATLGAVLRRGRSDVVSAAHGRGLDAVHLDHLTGEVEIHAISAVIAVEPQHTRAAIGGADRLDAGIDRRTREHVADSAGVEQAVADIAGEQRQMAGAAPGDDADLALLRKPSAANDAALLHQRGMCRDKARKQLIDERVGRIHQFLHCTAPATTICTPMPCLPATSLAIVSTDFDLVIPRLHRDRDRRPSGGDRARPRRRCPRRRCGPSSVRSRDARPTAPCVRSAPPAGWPSPAD
ncbi:hypothetical protein ACVWXO_010026 [Bradyrhizobium sp. LM2.7]